jgi:HAE1 family hydrophobic/amphiphilic exporter-1
MDRSISAPFIRYPIATSLLMAGILFLGLIAYPALPVAPLPQVDFPTIQISASLPGASVKHARQPDKSDQERCAAAG